MIGSAKTNANSVGLALATTIGLLMIFLASGFIFTSDNPFTKAAMLVGGLLLVVGIVQPRRMLILLVPISFYLDAIKRLLVMTGRTGLDDVTSVLAVAPLAAVGVIIGCVIRRIFFRKRREPIERFVVFSAVAAFVAFGGMEAFTAGNLLYGLRTAANSTVYFLLPWAVLQCFKTREEIERFLKFCILVGVPVALYGIWQYAFGLTQFEITYLRSGLTITGNNLEDIRPRPFSTLGSSHAYSNIMMFMLPLALYFTRSGMAIRRNWKTIAIALTYALALLFSMGRGAVFASIGMIVFAKLFRSKTGAVVAYSFSGACLGGMILFAQTLQDMMEKVQGYLPGNSDWQQQAFRLGTFSDRLMGYQNVLTNPGAWPLLANPLKFRPAELTYEDTTFSHDLFSQMILRVGIIPVFLGICVSIYILFRAHRAILRLPGGQTGIRPLAARLMAIIVVFLLTQAAGSGITVFPMNMWLGIFAGLLSVICLHFQNTSPREVRSSGPGVAAPAVTVAR